MNKENKGLYTFYFFLLGLIFPAAGFIYLVVSSGMEFSIQSLLIMHSENPLLWIIDLAPFVLAITSIVVGKQFERFREIKRGQSFFNALVMNSPLAVVQLDGDHKIVEANPSFEKLFGYTSSEISGESLDDLISTEALYNEAVEISRAVTSGTISRKVTRRKKKDGSLIDVEIFGVPVIEGGETIGAIGLYHDISEQVNIDQALKESEARFKSLFIDSPISLMEADFSDVKNALNELPEDTNFSEMILDDKTIIKKLARSVKINDMNQEALDFFSVQTKEEALENIIVGLSEQNLGFFQNVISAFEKGESQFEQEIEQKNKDGETISGIIQLSLAPGYQDNWGKVFVSIVDITERRLAEKKLHFMSFHDALTGLYNRAYFEEEISRLQDSRQFPITIIVSDMDNLKTINDTYGHDAGDSAIIGTAQILTKVFREEDIVARIGGDEFVVIIPCYDISENPSVLIRLEKEIVEYNDCKRDDDLFCPISLSIGFSVVAKGESLKEGHKNADQNMYFMKVKRNLNNDNFSFTLT
jgi:diguanylate cyclase (GGDEF)-like protein/PAS domain S-box-containing protein